VTPPASFDRLVPGLESAGLIIPRAQPRRPFDFRAANVSRIVAERSTPYGAVRIENPRADSLSWQARLG